jgi:N-formylglutamate amidohydrolase
MGESGPVLVTVPHAGREYPADVLSGARVGLAELRLLEDRHADSLIAGAVAAGHCAIVARRGRAVIDLNRHEHDLDRSSVGDLPYGAPSRPSIKLRGGLGLVPHRYHMVGDLWRRLPRYDEVRDRILTLHLPYHEQVDALLKGMADYYGGAVLLDIHSMPPIKPHGGDPPPQVVIGDRFGRSAALPILQQAMEVFADYGLRVGLNAPYAGGHTLDRHGRPQRGVHALQIEIDRTLYLDEALDQPGAGAPFCSRIIAELADALARPFSGAVSSLAAE